MVEVEAGLNTDLLLPLKKFCLRVFKNKNR